MGSTPPVAFSTESPLAWSRVVSASFVPLVADGIGDQPFAASIRGRAVDGVFFSRIRAGAHEVHRTSSLIDASERLFYKLMLIQDGTADLEQDDRVAHMAAGSLSVYDTSRPYRLTFPTRVDAIVVMLPRDLVEPSPAHMRTLTAMSLPGDDSLTRLVAPFLAELASDFHALEGPSATRVVRTAVDLISTLLSQAALEHGGDQRHLALMLRIREHIIQNLADPRMGPDSIARATYVSTRHLHELFREQGTTVSTWIRDRRIAAIRDQLADPVHADRSIGEIATAHGYPDPSHFSRTFRQVVGVSPRAFRAHATRGRPTEPSPADRPSPRQRSTTG